MLSQEIQEFIADLRTMHRQHPQNAVGCLTVGKDNLKNLVATLDMFFEKSKVGRIPHRVITPKTSLADITAPSLLIVTEEDYSKDPVFAEKVREKAAYFMNVGRV